MLALALLTAFLTAQPPVEPVNAAIGDVSWIARYGVAPTAAADPTERIRVHLDHVADRLADADLGRLTPTQRARRARAIAALRGYAARGVFPRRRADDGYRGRRPRFIDDRGVHCAVGELIRLSGHPALARSIDRQWSMAFVPDMASQPLLDWARAHGLTVHELAMIQPTYRELTLGTLQEGVDTVVANLLGPCGVEHAVPEELALRVELEPRSKVRITEHGPSTPFGACLVDRLMDRRSGASWRRWLGRPPQPRRTKQGLDWHAFDQRVPISPRLTPQLFEARLAALDLHDKAPECWARDWPRLLLTEVRITSTGAEPNVTVSTVPSEPGAVACFEAFARARLLREQPPRAPAKMDVHRAWSEPSHLPPETLARLARAEVCPHVDPCLRTSPTAADRAFYTQAAKTDAPEALRIPLGVAMTVDPIAVQIEAGPVKGLSPAFGACLAERMIDRIRSSLQRLHDAPSFPALDTAARVQLHVDCMPGQPESAVNTQP